LQRRGVATVSTQHPGGLRLTGKACTGEKRAATLQGKLCRAVVTRLHDLRLLPDRPRRRRP
jgi:hypothetical protein